MPRQPVQIDVLTRKDGEAAAGVLGRAFATSPVYLAVLAHLSPEARAAALFRVKRGFFAATVHHGASRAAWVDGAIAGVSLVIPPGGYPLGVMDEVRQATGCATTGPRAIAGFLRMSSYLRGRHPAPPHHYLFVLGVEPALQGRGIGKALLADLNEDADAARSGCYLETEKPENVRLYESVGYRVVTDEFVPGLPTVRMWTMWREPV